MRASLARRCAPTAPISGMLRPMAAAMDSAGAASPTAPAISRALINLPQLGADVDAVAHLQ